MAPTKLIIHAYSDEHLRSALGTCELQVNPSNVARTIKNEFSSARAVSGAGRVRTFSGIGEAGLTLEFFIDATGVIPGVTTVREKVAELRSTVSDFKGDIHSPPYLRVIWGDMDVACRFVTMSVDYVLFRPDGLPLRAKVNMELVDHVAPDTLVRSAAQSSPDLTHARVVQAGETLPLLCEQVYREDRYYAQVARHNDLDNLVSLAPGRRLRLPPLRD